MITYYCNEGQEKGSITIDEVTYRGQAPLRIEIKPARLCFFDGFIAYIADLSESVGWRIEGKEIPGNETRAVYHFEVNGIEVFSIFWEGGADGIPNIDFPTVNSAFFTTDASNKSIYKSAISPQYTINCDGCGEGECKGNKARYPGYDCLDCVKLKKQILSMGRRIDGITKR